MLLYALTQLQLSTNRLKKIKAFAVPLDSVPWGGHVCKNMISRNIGELTNLAECWSGEGCLPSGRVTSDVTTYFILSVMSVTTYNGTVA